MFVHCYLTHDSSTYTAKLQNLEVTARSEFQVQLNKDTVRIHTILNISLGIMMELCYSKY